VQPGQRRIPGEVFRSLQLRVLRFGLFQDWDVGVGIFPEGEEVLVRGSRLSGVTRHHVGSAELEMSQCSGHKVEHDSPVIRYFLKLGGGGNSIVCEQIGCCPEVR